MKVILSIFFLPVITSCASTPNAVNTEVIIEKAFYETSALLERQSRKCWRREATPFEAGISVDAKRSGDDGAIFTATREGLAGNIITGQTYEYSPFVEIKIKSLSQDTISLSVSEREFCSSFTFCSDLKFRQHLEPWFQGDTQCQPF